MLDHYWIPADVKKFHNFRHASPPSKYRSWFAIFISPWVWMTGRGFHHMKRAHSWDGFHLKFKDYCLNQIPCLSVRSRGLTLPNLNIFLNLNILCCTLYGTTLTTSYWKWYQTILLFAYMLLLFFSYFFLVFMGTGGIKAEKSVIFKG